MKIGIALGSGAARGWAHIGVIQALEKLGVKIDVVAGCSIGAYVGAAYASGRLEELKGWASSLTEWQTLSLMGIGIRRGGLASGQKVFDKLSDEFCAATFETMEKPFACVATDLYSGREVVFNKGDVGNSIQASCAIPALFSPIAYNDRWLVDGAVVNPVPVNLCRQLGADFVIAVNLNADFRPLQIARETAKHEETQEKNEHFFKKSQDVVRQWFSPEPKDNNKQAPGILSVMSSSLEILQARVTRSRLAGEPPDILIEPTLTDVGLMEFHRCAELCETGEQVVKRLAEQIRYQLVLDEVLPPSQVDPDALEAPKAPDEANEEIS
ncbi:MAG: patatin-like phospholipase RssA [Alteromonadaceae bacterium TMED7]|nr:patatin-like phospholipase RssA [Alteromonas sp.]RPH15684.1 MAG: patatin-like phospholipase RssA [Alteromonadaceae bacterium TMED7]|tara:strand:- start:13026 stop:14003 length:978 start_codon:yes stop_codon:yes gene_type:complete